MFIQIQNNNLKTTTKNFLMVENFRVLSYSFTSVSRFSFNPYRVYDIYFFTSVSCFSFNPDIRMHVDTEKEANA